MGEDDKMFMTRKLRRYAKDNRTAHLTARSDKSVAYVTNNKTLRFVLLKLTTDRYEASHGVFATAELLVYPSCCDAMKIYCDMCLAGFGKIH